jgi:hypothetical protein
MKNFIVWSLLLLVTCNGLIEACRIVLFQFGGPVPNSHFILEDRVALELASRGHTVMVGLLIHCIVLKCQKQDFDSAYRSQVAHL